MLIQLRRQNDMQEKGLSRRLKKMEAIQVALIVTMDLLKKYYFELFIIIRYRADLEMSQT